MLYKKLANRWIRFLKNINGTGKLNSEELIRIS